LQKCPRQAAEIVEIETEVPEGDKECGGMVRNAKVDNFICNVGTMLPRPLFLPLPILNFHCSGARTYLTFN